MSVRILFRPHTVITGRFRDKYWIGDDIIPQKIIEGASFIDALSNFCTLVENYGICFSKSALKNKSPMYVDDCEGNERQLVTCCLQASKSKVKKSLFSLGEYG